MNTDLNLRQLVEVDDLIRKSYAIAYSGYSLSILMDQATADKWQREGWHLKDGNTLVIIPKGLHFFAVETLQELWKQADVDLRTMRVYWRDTLSDGSTIFRSDLLLSGDETY